MAVNNDNKNQLIQKQIKDKLMAYFVVTPKKATKEQMYKAISLVIKDRLIVKRQECEQEIVEKSAKRVYYICLEFLIGRNLRNALYNLGLEQDVKKAVEDWNFKIDDLYEVEADPGLGNGGLGRLAACFMDSLATCNYPAMGFSIRYDYGLFKQRIVDNQQVELPDFWLDSGEVWMVPGAHRKVTVNIGGVLHEDWIDGKLKVSLENAEVIEAYPYDIMISGTHSDAVTPLRLWRATAPTNFDMKSFSQGDYMDAMRADNEAEIISKVLYPSDSHDQGKQLRLMQQYFLVSASLQNIINDHLKVYENLDNLSEKAAIHINDTHPALAIAELMRLLLDDYNYSWEDAWHTTFNCMAYTNHTVLAEALETWNEAMIQALFPRVHQILKEIDRRFSYEALEKTNNDIDKVQTMNIFDHGIIRMANLSVIGSHSVNGVSALHSQIIKDSVFKNFYSIYPERFTNVTNGIAYRRWLCQSNAELTDFISGLIGDGFKKDASKLSKLLKFEKDTEVLKNLGQIKVSNKKHLADYFKKETGFELNPYSRFDTQIKRLHEYKRQLLNVLKIIHYYIELKENPNKEFTPQTFIFGAKAAGGYFHAKRIIHLINSISAEIQKDKKIKEKLDVMFVENYNVSIAERLFPASEVSEQISLAGKEASGTGNMKFMLNGAITLGTIDGANVEILENVGKDNIFTFGLKADEVENIWRHGYYATNYFAADERIRKVVDKLKEGFNGESFADIANYVVVGVRNVADPFMCLADFNDYLRACDDLDKAYCDKPVWNKMALNNIAKAGVFSADRSIHEYAKNIWDLKPLNSK